jgi:hypothetical protein
MGQRADKSAVRAINRRLRGRDGCYRAWVAMGDVVYVDELEHGFRLLVYYSVVLKTRKNGRGVFYDPPSWRASVLGSA